jgi:hypothetical protein
MMQTADLGDGRHSSPPRRLDDAREESVVVQSAMRPRMVVIIEVAGQDALEVGFVDHDDMIQALPPDRADQPFDVGVLPRRPRRGQHFLDACTLQAFPKAATVGAVAVADQVTRRLVKGEGLPDLAGDPNGAIRILLLTFLAAQPRARL